ncbi:MULTISPECIES: YvrJ family protein [Cytobacillus]|uniref:YvrJ family protein n=1 Tax=Cytobacillus TaxID=2675230 RepID=UPI00300283FE
MEDIQAWITVMGNFGFPVVVSIYLLVRFEKKIETLGSTIQELGEIIRSTKT